MAKNNVIPVFVPHMPKYKQLKQYLKEIDKTKIYSNFGPLNEELKLRIGKLIGVDVSRVATCVNATQAITGVLATLPNNYSNTSEVLCPSWTFAATPNAIANANKEITFVDIDLQSWQSDIPKNINSVGIHVLPFGDAYTDFSDFDDASSPPLIIDAAASFANLQSFELPKNRTWVIILSLHATKLLGAGEGAVVASNDSDWIKRFVQWSNFGFWGKRESSFLGTNAKLSEYGAAVALGSLDNFDETLNIYKSLNQTCLGIASELDLKLSPAMAKGLISPYWIVVFESKKLRDKIEKIFNQQKIETRKWWSNGCHEMPAFKNAQKFNLPTTEKLATCYLGLPFHYQLTEECFIRISKVLEESKFD